MAVGKAICKCSKCGREYEVRREFSSRREADWFENRMRGDDTGLCRECWREVKREEVNASPVKATISISPKSRTTPVIIELTGGTYPVAEGIKQLDYSYTSFCNAWSKHVGFDDVEEELTLLAKLKEIEVVKYHYSHTDYEEWVKAECRRELADKAFLQAEQIVKPIKPKWMGEGYWNGRVYGGSKKQSIYVDGRVIALEDGMVMELKEYNECVKQYNNTVREIKKIAETTPDDKLREAMYVASVVCDEGVIKDIEWLECDLDVEEGGEDCEGCEVVSNNTANNNECIKEYLEFVTDAVYNIYGHMAYGDKFYTYYNGRLKKGLQFRVANLRWLKREKFDYRMCTALYSADKRIVWLDKESVFESYKRIVKENPFLPTVFSLEEGIAGCLKLLYLDDEYGIFDDKKFKRVYNKVITAYLNGELVDYMEYIKEEVA